MNKSLTPTQKALLTACEAEIEKNMEGAKVLASALQRIKSQKLYQAEYGTFEEYCERRWNRSRRWGYQVIEAAEVAENVQSIAQNCPPLTTTNAVLLSSLPADEQAEAYEEAVATAPEGKVTAKHVKAVVEDRKERSSGASKPRKKSNPLWDEIESMLAKAQAMFVKACEECDEASDVIDAITEARNKLTYYRRITED